MNIIILGLSITSSWGNGHATTYRGLVRELVALGHDILFLERDVPWYSMHRDLHSLMGAEIEMYSSLQELRDKYLDRIQSADAVIVGSYVPEGVEVGNWVLKHAQGVTAFYDIDTPVTLANLHKGKEEYLAADQIPKYNLYLSFAGGPTLQQLEKYWHSPMARPLYCSVDTDHYYPERRAPKWDMGYLGTYSDDRQPSVERLLMETARRRPEASFAVAGAQYPSSINWPENVEYSEHLPPDLHCGFYNQQRYTLNITRASMIEAGYSPSVRLFEAAACGTPIISDRWPGLETFFRNGHEILIADTTSDVLRYLSDISENERRRIGQAARNKVLSQHTAAHRAQELVSYLNEAIYKHPTLVHVGHNL